MNYLAGSLLCTGIVFQTMPYQNHCFFRSFFWGDTQTRPFSDCVIVVVIGAVPPRTCRSCHLCCGNETSLETRERERETF